MDLADLERSKQEILSVFRKVLVGRGIGNQDFYLAGIAKRAIAQHDAFLSCVESKNFLVSSALLRLQLDTVLRLYCLYWVDDPEEFSKQVMEGKQINDLLAADGKKMSDRYLIGRLEAKNDWIPRVYKNTSGTIHFSKRHIFMALDVIEGEFGKIVVNIHPSNSDHTLEDYSEMIAAFSHCNLMIAEASRDWYDRFHTIPQT